MWKCVNCDSTDVEELSWVDKNTGTTDIDAGGLEEYYCNKCNKQTEIYYDFEEDTNDDADVPDDTSGGDVGD